MSLAFRERHRHWPRRLTLALCLLAAPAFAQAAPPPDPGAPLPYVIGLHEAYLKAYPDGKFAAIAQARIAQLAAAETPDPTISEGDQQEDTASKTDGKRQKNNSQADDQQQASQDDAQEPADDQAQQEMDQAGPEEQQANANMGGLKTKQNQDDQQQTEFTEGSEDTEDAILDRDTRHELQGRLSSLGYDTLGTDGVFGERSRDAIASWQQDSGAPVTGYLSEDQVQAIFTASAATYATWLASRVPVRVHRVRPRTEWVLVRPRNKIVVMKRRPNAVVVVKPFRNKFKNRVKVKTADDKSEWRDVITGYSDGESIEIREGLSEGEQVFTKAPSK